MFIAVINEDFAEKEKIKQLTYFHTHRSVTWLRRLNPYRWLKPSPVTVKVDNFPSDLVLPMRKVLVQDKSTRLDGVRTATTVSL